MPFDKKPRYQEKGDSIARMYAITVNKFIRKINIPSIMLIFIPTNLHFPIDILSIPLLLFLILHPHLT